LIEFDWRGFILVKRDIRPSLSNRLSARAEKKCEVFVFFLFSLSINIVTALDTTVNNIAIIIASLDALSLQHSRDARLANHF
jgi:hypothetical protein